MSTTKGPPAVRGQRAHTDDHLPIVGRHKLPRETLSPDAGGGAARERSEDAAEAWSALLLRDEVLSTLLHELKEPLYGISLHATLIGRLPAGAPTGGRLESYVAEIHQALSRVNLLVGDLLEIDRFGEGDLAMDLRSHDTLGLVEAALRVARPLARARGVGVSARVLPGADRVECDRARVIQVIAALVLEGVRRTRPGGQVRFTAAHKGTMIHLSVRAEGVALSEAEVSELLAPAVDDGASTLPLRMFMARRSVELHRGALSARADGDGTVFDAAIPSPYGAE